jgi:hypothetical protein
MDTEMSTDSGFSLKDFGFDRPNVLLGFLTLSKYNLESSMLLHLKFIFCELLLLVNIDNAYNFQHTPLHDV